MTLFVDETDDPDFPRSLVQQIDVPGFGTKNRPIPVRGIDQTFSHKALIAGMVVEDASFLLIFDVTPKRIAP